MNSNSLDLQALVIGREGAALTPPITLQLAAGEMLAVRGNNGAGKSTFLKTLAGLLSPHSGRLYRQGRGGAILYFGHKLGLSKEMSVYDNVSLWARLHQVPELSSAAMHYFDLTEIADIAVSKLSAGWQQRVALTRLITTPSHLWLLDEPNANLDSEGIGLLQSLIQSRLEQGGIVGLATHGQIEGNMIKQLNLSTLN